MKHDIGIKVLFFLQIPTFILSHSLITTDHPHTESPSKSIKINFIFIAKNKVLFEEHTHTHTHRLNDRQQTYLNACIIEFIRIHNRNSHHEDAFNRNGVFICIYTDQNIFL